MLEGSRKRCRRHLRQRRLRVEGLETRWMLAGDTGDVLEVAASAAAVTNANWHGFMVSDLNGHLLDVDVGGTLHANLLANTSIALFDIAVAPSGRVFGLGGPSEGPSVLYELNVDFDNPGASLDPVMIGWIETSGGGSVWMNGLEFNAQGALLGAGYDFFGNNYLYSLDASDATATELVNLGGYRAAGDVTADEDGAVYTVTFGGDLIRVAPDYSSYYVVGQVGVADIYGMTYGPGPVLRGYQTDGRALNINPNDASWIAEGWIYSTTVPYLGYLLGASTIFDPPTVLGEIDFVELTSQSSTLGQRWYRFDAMHDGYATVELDDLTTTTGVQVTLHRVNAGGNLDAVSTGTTRVDHAAAVAGDRYFVEITGLQSDVTVRVGNQVDPGADTLTIHGTDIHDELELVVGSTYHVAVNGIDYEISFPAAAFVTTTFDAAGGADSARVVGGDENGFAEFDLTTQSGVISGPTFAIALSSTAWMEFDGQGGIDSVEIRGTDANGALDLAPSQASIVEGAVRAAVANVEDIWIDAAGGADYVVFNGGSWPDQVELSPTTGRFREVVPAGEARDPVYSISTANVEANLATGNDGDIAFLRDSEGDETFVAELDVVTYSGPGHVQELRGFRTVHAYGLNGGTDQASIYDTMGDDKFKGKEDSSLLRGGGFYFRAKGFETVESSSVHGGNDYAVFYDTAGDDLFTASYELARMTNGTLSTQATGFGRVQAYSTRGFDTARLQDSPDDDELRCRSHKSTFRSLDSTPFDITVRAFDEVHAEAIHGGNDIGKMHDTPGDNHLTGTGDNAQMYRGDGGSLELLYDLVAFERVKAYWSTGNNTKEITPPIDFTYLELTL